MGRIKPTVSITLPIDLLDKVDREAALHKCSRSAVIEKAGWLYFDLVWPQYKNNVLRRSKMKDECSSKSRRVRGR